MARIVCLANSFKDEGRCLAGIDLDTGRWVRPVPMGGGAVPAGWVTFGGDELRPLDLIEVNLDPAPFPTRYQCENRQLLNPGCRLIGRLSPAETGQYCEFTETLLHSNNDRVSPGVLDPLPPEKWKSLQLIRPSKLAFEKDGRVDYKWRAHFRDFFGTEYKLRLTDPAFVARLKRGDRVSPRCYLAISLTEPFVPKDGGMAPMCYKLVAGVVELV